MKNILGLVAEVEDKAVAILDSAKAQKQQIKEEENKKRTSLEKKKKKEYEQKIFDYQSHLDQTTVTEISNMENQVKHNEQALTAYYEKNVNRLVNQLTKQVIGE